MERIECAAIRHAGKVYSVPRPGRHHNVIRIMSGIGLPAEATTDQGFVTSSGRFVDRMLGVQIASAAKQIRNKTGPEWMLFSEDLW